MDSELLRPKSTVLNTLQTALPYYFAVLQPENATDSDPNADFGHCGANYCPDTVVNSTGDNFSIEDKQRYMLFGIYLVSAILGAGLVALTVDPLSRLPSTLLISWLTV